MYAFVKQGGQFLATKRTDGVSTSDIIARVLRHANAYMKRNIERGCPLEEVVDPSTPPAAVSDYRKQIRQHRV